MANLVVSQRLALLLIAGGLLNTFCGYDWLPLRATDLYSWAPCAQSYRAHRGSGQFILPLGFVPSGQRVEDLPGIQVFEDAQQLVGAVPSVGVLITTISEGTNDDPRLLELRRKLEAHNITQEMRLHVQNIKVVVDVDQSIPFSWNDWFTKTSYTRVGAYAYDRFGSQTKKDFGIKATDKTYFRAYPTSIVYWILMCLPIALVLKTKALFERPLGPNWIFVKYSVVDTLAIICCLLEAQSDASIGNLPHISLGFVLTLAVINLVATRLYRRNSQHRVAWFLAMLIQALTLAVITYGTFKREMKNDERVVSMTRFILGQLLLANIVTEGLLLSYPTEKRDFILSGLTKYVVSFMFYSGGATKVGEAGLGWIDERFLAMLALIGRYGAGTHPFLLERIMLYVPGVLRAAGMVVIWSLELSSLLSWWYFETYLALWGTFMLGSTMAIGVPFRAELIGPLLHELVMADVASTLVAPAGILVVVVVGVLLWRRTNQNGKKVK